MTIYTQSQVYTLIAKINAFADQAEAQINQGRKAYEDGRRALDNRHSAALRKLEQNYSNNCNVVRTRFRKSADEIQQMLTDVEFLDAKLIRVDKYYRKTKKKKETELANVTSERYNDEVDYFRALEDIRSQYTSISKKYSERILPALINGLHYLFSSARKKDYEELIVLLNTIRRFEAEIESELPGIMEESLSDQRKAYLASKQATDAANQREDALFEAKTKEVFEVLAEHLYDELDRLLPDEDVAFLAGLMTEYQANLVKVNTGASVPNDVFCLCYVDYPVGYFVQSPVVASIIQEKGKPILVDGNLRFPIAFTTHDAPVWMINNQGQEREKARGLSHSLMYAFLSSCPIARMSFSVIDPEFRGDSIQPFFRARNQLPELFGEKIYISRDEIAARLSTLNQKIDDILQVRLSTEYATIFDYAKDHPDYQVTPELLLLYDFPKGFDEQGIAALKNVLRNGNRCGIYTVILTGPVQQTARGPEEFNRVMKEIGDFCCELVPQNDCFLLRGMPLLYHQMPDVQDFNRFFGKYMILYEGIKNRGIAFSPLIKKLVDLQDRSALEAHIRQIGAMLKAYQEQYFTVPSVDAQYPSNITLGTVLYPADIFSDSPFFDIIQRAFNENEGVKLMNQLSLPLNLTLSSSFNMLLNSPEQTQEEIRQFTHHVIWSLFSFLPVTKVNIKAVDVENRNSTRPFADLRKALPELFTVITNQEKVSELLRDLNTQIDDFTQNKLGARYENFLEYNQNTPRRSESATLLVLYDFPRGFDARSVDTLISILRNGNRCGIFTLICHDPNAAFSRYESLDERLELISKYSISAEYKDKSFRLLPFGLPVSVPAPRTPDGIADFVHNYVEAANVVKHRGISFDDILPQTLYDSHATKMLKIPIGIGDEDATISLTFGEGTSHHCLIGGGTGGGKSTLLHTIIMSGMLHYSPDELHLYLMDFKGGTEFKVYESQRLPHINLIALDALQEFGESILENLVQEMEHRSQMFKDSGGYSKLQDYVEGTGKPMPRILIIMDEFQILFNDATNRKVAMNCANLAKRIVTEGRAYGMHLMMATQSTNIISTLTLDRGTIEQMRIRIGLKCGEADTRYLFSDLYCSDAKMKMMGPKGTAVLNEDYTETPENNDTSLQLGNIGLRVAYCNDELKEKYLQVISESFQEVSCSTQVFEGSRTVPLLDYFAEAGISFTNQLPVCAHMGDKIKVAPPFSLTLDRKKKHNVLICGSDQQMTDNVLNNYLISVLLNHHSRVFCIDGDDMVGDATSAGFYQVLKDNTGRFYTAETRVDIVQFISDVYECYQERKKKNERDIICVVLKNLQYLDLIKAIFKGDRIEESEYLDSEEEPAEPEEPRAEASFDPMDIFADFNSVVSARNARQSASAAPKRKSAQGYSNEKLLKLIEDGSGFGIHFVITSSDYQTVKETMRFGENVLAKFPERFVFALSNTDADNLIEGVSVASLNSNLVYFTDGVRETFQLKPYIAPSAEALSNFFKSCGEG